jgi:hypothetical protein
MSRYKPALLGGLFIGVLSNLPVVNIANVCCCLWVVAGGVLATFLLQQKTPEPITTSDAMLGGVIAGLVGAVITVAVSALTLSVTGPLWQEPVRQALDRPDMPPEVRDFVLKLMTGGGITLLQAIVTLPCYAVFSMLGSLLGVAFFRKKVTPQPPAAPTA